MASQVNFDGEFARVTAKLAAMRADLAPPAAMLQQAVRDMLLPPDETLAAEEVRLNHWRGERQLIEAALAAMIAGLAGEIDVVRTEFYNREAPTGGEKLVGYFSKAAMQRRQVERWRSPVSRDKLADLVRQADGLSGLLTEERGFLTKTRRTTEADLVAFIDHRPRMIETLRGEDGQAMSKMEAIRRTERFVAVSQLLVDGLNLGVSACNLLQHKLAADLEDLLVLYRAVSEESGRDHVMTLTPGDFPHIADAILRYSRDKLLVHDIDRRKQVANLAFSERFESRTAAQASVDAALLPA